MVLVVEDKTDVRELFAEILVRAGFDVVEAANGHEAIVKACALRPQAILMDLSLPMLGGLEAARVLRAAEGTRRIPLVALTGRPMDTRDRGDFDGVLQKPCMPDALVRRVRAVLLRARKAAGAR